MSAIPLSPRVVPTGRAMFGRTLALLVALLALGIALRNAILSETPTGSVQGQVFLADLHQPLAGVTVSLLPVNSRADQYTRTLHTGHEGRFTFANVPVGIYHISASSRAHSTEDEVLYVEEGRAALITLSMTRSEPALQMRQHQRMYGSDEVAKLSVSGYIDGSKPHRSDSLKVRVFRTKMSRVMTDKDAPNALEEVGRSYDPVPSLPKALLHPANAPSPTLLSTRSIAITEDDREGFFYQSLPLGTLSHGLYLVDVKHDEESVCAWLLVTNTALVVKRAGPQMLAYVVSMKTGEPITNSRVITYSRGRKLAQGVTDQRGLSETTLPALKHKTPPASNSDSNAGDEEGGGDGDGDNSGDNGYGRLLTVAYQGEDEAVVQREGYGDESDGDWVIHAYTDRPIYRPGHLIYFKGIVRRRPPQPTAPIAADVAAIPVSNSPRYEVPQGQPVRVELRDPGGERLLQTTLRTNRSGSFIGQAQLLNESPTGVYSLIMTINGKKQTQDIVVASYQKPEFAVTVSADKKRYVQGETVTMTVSGQYFFGTPLAGAKVRYSVYRNPDWASEYADLDSDASEEADNTPPSEPGFAADYGESVTNGETRLDENGKAVVTFPGNGGKTAQGSAQAQNYTLSATVEEGQDRESEATGEVRVVAGDYQMRVQPDGYVAAPGQPTGITVTTRDWDNKPVANRTVALEWGYDEWRHDTGIYQKVGVQNITTGPNGQAIVTLTPPRAGNLRLVARSYDDTKRKIVARATLWAAGDDPDDLNTTYSDLSLLTDKRHYNPGETARVLINTSRLGETVLLTVEGERVYGSQTLKISKHSTVVRVAVPRQFGPNVFLNACYVQDKHFAQTETALRVSLPEAAIQVHLTPDHAPPTGTGAENQSGGKSALPRYQPGQRVTYRVQTTDAENHPVPAEVSLGVVDEAIYALREDTPRALRNAFYPQRQNRVNTSYSFEIAFLGDADKAEPLIAARKKFEDTAYWQPDIATDANGQARVTFTLPDNLTTWRATATAHTSDTRLGRTTDKILVTKDFFVRLQTPRTLTQKDQTELVALVHNETGQPQSAVVKLTGENLNIAGEASQAISLTPGQIAQVHWTATAEQPADASLRLTAWTTGTGSTRYTDGVEKTLPVRPYGRERIVTAAGQVTDANPETEVLRLEPGAIPSVSRLTIRLTPSLTGSLTGGVDYLIGFPYGCVEQTLSRFLPDLMVQKTMRLHGGVETEKAGSLAAMTRESLQRLYRFQHSTGAWGWWQYDKDDVWMTAYVLYGLAIAEREGTPVSKSVLVRGLDAALKMLPKCKPDEKPFLMYALALNGLNTTVNAARGHIALNGIGVDNLAYIALADRALGRSSSPALALLEKRAIVADGMRHWEEQSSFHADAWDATALALKAILAYHPNDPQVNEILRWLMTHRTGEYWGSTRATAWTLSALCDYLAAHPDFNPGGQVAITLNGTPIKTVVLDVNNRREQEIVVRVPASQLRPEKNDIMLTRSRGTSPVFYAMQLRQTVGGDAIPALSGAGIKVEREYLRVLSKKSGQSYTIGTEPMGSELHTGDNVRVRLTLTVPRDMAYVLIEDAFPAGCEPNERGDTDAMTDWSFWWSSVDVRDDRIAFFARTLEKGKHVIEYNLRVQTPGAYHALPTLLQAMYDPNARSESAETPVTIR